VAGAAGLAVERRARGAAAADRGDPQVARVEPARVVEVAVQLAVDELADALALQARLGDLAEVEHLGARGVEHRRLVDLAVAVVVDAVGVEEAGQPRLGPLVGQLEQLGVPVDLLAIAGAGRDLDLVVAAVAVDAAQLEGRVDLRGRDALVARDAGAVELEVVLELADLGLTGGQRGGGGDQDEAEDVGRGDGHRVLSRRCSRARSCSSDRACSWRCRARR
jgi:hypothetical protein